MGQTLKKDNLNANVLLKSYNLHEQLKLPGVLRHQCWHPALSTLHSSTSLQLLWSSSSRKPTWQSHRWPPSTLIQICRNILFLKMTVFSFKPRFAKTKAIGSLTVIIKFPNYDLVPESVLTDISHFSIYKHFSLTSKSFPAPHLSHAMFVSG